MSVLPLFTLENMGSVVTNSTNSNNNSNHSGGSAHQLGVEDLFLEPGMTCLTAIVIVVNLKGRVD